MIYIYNDTGTCMRSIQYIQKNFTAIDSDLQFMTIDASGIIKGDWRHDARARILPGGADIPYGNKLNGFGNQQITAYVTHGGTFIGICAGAYYASNYIEFDRRGPLAVVDERALKFYPGMSVGPVLAPYDYHIPSGARTAKIQAVNEHQLTKYHCYYNGGGYFVDAYLYENVKVLYTYHAINGVNPASTTTQALAAIVECRVAKGKAILSGVHYEWCAEDVAETLNALSKDSDLYVKIQAIASILADQTSWLVLKDMVGRIS